MVSGMERLLLCAVFFITCVTAQWSTYDFVKVETYLISTQANIKRLFDVIQKEKVKMYGSNTLNGSIPASGGMALAYGSFFEDVERRLADIENSTNELSIYMRVCPDAPMAPPKPQNVLTESTTIDGISTIVISWDPLPVIPDNLQYKVYFQPLEIDGSIAQPEVVFRICDASQTSASITDLAPKSRYRIRVAAVDGQVVESYSIPEVLYTPDLIPSPPVNLRGTALGPNSIKLDWDPPHIRGDITQYKVVIHDSYTMNNQTVDIRPAVEYLNAVDLTEGTTHHFAVTAFSDNGESDQSEQFMVSTPSFIPPEVMNPFAEAFNTTTIRVTFEPPYSTEGKIRGYRVHYTDFLAEPEQGEVETNNPTATEMWVHNLQPNKDYYFAITAFTRRSASFPTSYVATKSKAAVPSQVRNVRCRTLRTDPPMIQVRWEPPLHMYAQKKPEYHIMWGVKNGVFRNETITNMSVSWTSDFLDDNLLHRFIIAAKNDKGIGNEVEVVLKTPKREFDTPKNIKVGRMKKGNTTMLAVNWDPMPVPVMGFRVLHRVFQWIYQGRWTITEVPDPNARSATIPIVNPTLSYIVVVRAKLLNGPRGNRRTQRKEDVMKCTIVVHKDKNAGAGSALDNLAPAVGSNTGGGPTNQGGMGVDQGMGSGPGMSGMGSGPGMGGMGSGPGMGVGSGTGSGQGMGPMGNNQGMGPMGNNQGMGPMGNNQGMGPMGNNQGMGPMGNNQGMGPMGNNQGMGPMGNNPGMGPMGNNQGMGPMGNNPGMGPMGNNQGMGPMGNNPGMGPMGNNQGMSPMGGNFQGNGMMGNNQGFNEIPSPTRPTNVGGSLSGGNQVPGGGQRMGSPGMSGNGGGQGSGGQGMSGQGMGGQGMNGQGMGGQGMGGQGMGGQGMGGQGMNGQGMGGQGMGGQGMGGQGMNGQGMGGQGMSGMGGPDQEMAAMGGDPGMGGNQGRSGMGGQVMGGGQGMNGMGSQGMGGNQGRNGMGGQGMGGQGMGGMGSGQGMRGGFQGSNNMIGGPNQGMGGNNPDIPRAPTQRPPSVGGNQRFGGMSNSNPMGGMPQNNPMGGQMSNNQGGMPQNQMGGQGSNNQGGPPPQQRRQPMNQNTRRMQPPRGNARRFMRNNLP